MQKTTKITALTALLFVVIVGLWFASGDGADQAADNQSASTTAANSYFRDHTDSLAGTTTDYYPEAEGITGYLSRPESASSENQRPGIILIHEWWGLNEDIKQMADDYAEEGYVALAVDMYGEPATASSTVAQQRSQQVRENMDEAMANLGAAVDYLEGRGDVDSTQLATVGWCFGGGWAYQMAVNDIGVDASVMYYGQFDPQDDFASMRSSILGHFGEEDAVVSVDNAREFKAELERADQSSAVYIYPNVGHSFANYQGGDNLAYDPASAETAWNRTLNFLSEQLNQAEEGAGNQNGNSSNQTAGDVSVRYTDDGFTPQQVTVSVGDTVRFVNESDSPMWVASDQHPTHAAYDGTSLREHCGQAAGNVFDQCGAEEAFTFTFDKAGEWSYHNHERAADGGTITVN